MKYLFGLITCLIMLSCKSKDSPIEKQLSGADSLLINFNELKSNIISKSVTTTEFKAINKLMHFVDSKVYEAKKCDYNGNLVFYKQGELKGDISFNYFEDGCRYFIQDINGELSSTKMSNEAADFLKSLADGKDWY